MDQNKSDSGEVDASKDNSQVDAPEKKDGDSGNADDSSKSQNASDDTDKKTDEPEKKPEEKKEIDLEELTYKERYGNSVREMQEIKNDPIKLRKFLGLDPDDSLDEHFGISDNSKDDSDDSKSDDKENDQDDEETSNTELPYKQMKIKPEEQAAIDLIWDNFSEKHPDIEKPKVREALQKNFFRFLSDDAGNRRSLKHALEDTYRFISMDDQIKKAQEQGRNEGIIKTQQNKEGTSQSSSSQQPKKEPNKGLTEEQKKTAKALGLKEEDYLANIKNDED